MINMATGLFTADALQQLPRGTWRYELVRGELHRMSPSGFEHGRIAARLAAQLDRFVEENGLGAVCGAETGFLLRRHPDTVRAPDLGFIGAARLALLATPIRGYFPGAPDLAIEIRSPFDRDHELQVRISDWIDAGARAVVLVDGDRACAEIYRAGRPVDRVTRDAYLELTDIVSGWTVTLAEILG